MRDEFSLEETIPIQDIPKQPWYKQYLRYIPYILCIIFAFLWINSCDGLSQSEAKLIQKEVELSQLKKEYTLKENSYKITQDSLNNDNQIKADSIRYFQKEHTRDSIKLADNNKKRIKTKAKLDRYTHNDFAIWFGKRYHEVDKVTSTPNGIELKDEIPKLVAKELVDYDFAREELQIKNKTILDYKSEIEQYKGIINNKNTEISQSKTLLEEQKDINEKQEDVLKDTKKELKNEKLKNKLLNIGVPAALITGFLGGILLVK